MEPAQHIAFLRAQLAQAQASLRYEKACSEAAERRLRAFEHSRVGGFLGPILRGKLPTTGPTSLSLEPDRASTHFYDSTGETRTSLVFPWDQQACR